MKESELKAVCKGWKRYGSAGTVCVCELEDGGVMLANSFVAWRPGLLTAGLFAKYNLDHHTVGRYTVNGTISRDEGRVPDLARIVSSAAAEERSPAAFRMLGRHRMAVELGDQWAYLLQGENGASVGLNRDYVRVLEDESAAVSWTVTSDCKVVIGHDQAGGVAGLVMPVRLS